MTKATFTFKNSQPLAFNICGHAAYDEKGKDIVCSAISSATFTSLNLITSICKNDEYRLIQNEPKGEIDFKLFSDNKFARQIIINLMHVLEGIATDYPKNLKVILQNKPTKEEVAL